MVPGAIRAQAIGRLLNVVRQRLRSIAPSGPERDKALKQIAVGIDTLMAARSDADFRVVQTIDLVSIAQSIPKQLEPDEAFGVALQSLTQMATSQLSLSNESSSLRALEILTQLGPNAGSAVPELVKILKSRDARLVGPAVDTLASNDTSKEKYGRILASRAAKALPDQQAAIALDALGTTAITKSLADRLTDPSQRVRRTVHELLHRHGRDQPIAVNALINAMGHESAEVRRDIQLTLELLLKALDHPRPAVRLAAVERLASNAQQSRIARPALVLRKDDKDPNVRAAIRRLLEKLDE